MLTDSNETKRARFFRNSERFRPFITKYFCFVSLISYYISGCKPPLLFLFIFEFFTQGKMAVLGLQGSVYWTVFRCILKLLSYVTHVLYAHEDFFWVIIEVHLVQINPNFMDHVFFGNLFSFLNVIFFFFANHFYFQKSIIITLALTLTFIYQHFILMTFKDVYAENTTLLEQQLSEYQSVLLSIKSHVIKTDLNFNILLINKGFLGKSVDNLIGSNFKNLPIFDEEKFHNFIKTKKTETHKIQVIHEGKTFLFLVAVSPIWMNGEMVGMTILCTDSTYELEIKQKKIEHEKQIYALKSKTEFMASISHEVRNPLQALTFSIENLLSNEPRKDQIGILNEAQSSNQLINHIIGDILDSSKIESGNFQLQNKNFEILESIESALKINIPQATKKSLDFTYSIDYQIPRMIKGDSQRLIQILSNLMSNSIKYTQQGKIELFVRNIEKIDKNWIHFSIKDTGIGIQQENFTKIFTMFEQINESNNSNGWGMGLAIVKGLLDLMQGRYGVESEHGVGSTFWFEIPYEKLNEQQNLFDSLPISNFSSVILVLQDNEISSEMNKILDGMNATNVCITKSKEKISKTYENNSDCKIFVDDDLIYQIPSNIPQDKIRIIGNSSKENSEYNDCLRIFKPILPSHLILELTPTMKKKFSGEENLLEGAIVLIVEDHIVIQKCLKKMIQKMNPLKILVAENGEQGLNHYQNENRIDLILTDINMPVMNGFELIKSIRKLKKLYDSKFVVTTGELNIQKLGDFIKEWNVDDILLKPITYKSLITSIRNTFSE